MFKGGVLLKAVYLARFDHVDSMNTHSNTQSLKLASLGEGTGF